MIDYPPFFQTVDDLERLHRFAIERWGGIYTPPKVPCLEGATGSAFQSMMYRTDREVDGLLYACALRRNLALDHCATDGNKRLAWLSFVDALAIEGLSIMATTAEAIELVEDKVIKAKLDVAGIAEWTAPRLVPF